MTNRPLSRDEVAYLERTKAALDAAFQTLLISTGLVALPVGFVAFTLTGRGGFTGDRVATAIAGFILIGLIAAVVYYSALGSRRMRWDRERFQAWRGLGADIEDRTAAVETVEIQAKGHATETGGGPEGPRRRYFIKAGDRRYWITGARWMSLVPGSRVTLEVAPHSGVVLAVDGLPDRLPLPHHPEPEPELRPGGG